MSRYVVTVAGTYGGLRYDKGQVAELTAAQVTTIGAGNLRAVNNPTNGVQVTTYASGGTSSTGTPAGSPTHDLAGEGAGASN